MKKLSRDVRLTAFLLAALMTLTGCAQKAGNFKIIDTLSSEEFVLGFRSDDRLQDYVQAGLKVLAAQGKLTELSLRWFGKDITMLEGDAQALEEYKDVIPQERVFIVGFDEGAPPLSFRETTGALAGFDIELARELGKLLGWTVKLLSINPSNAGVELSSGNIDCAWGGMSFGADQLDKIDTSLPYLRNKKVLVTMSGTGVGGKGSLKNKTIGMTYDSASLEALNADSQLSKSIKAYIQFKSTQDCIAALEKGECSAIILDSLAVEYYSQRLAVPK